MKSEQINELAAALSKAQGLMAGVVKGGYNPHFKSHFSTLEDTWLACREPLQKNGLTVTQTFAIRESMPVLVTTLMHSSGQWIDGEYPLNPTKPDPQGLGAAVTYARRYSLSAIVGLFSEEDDDGNKASGHKPNAPPVSTKSKSAPIQPALQSNAAGYIIKFGKYKGLSINNIPLADIKNYVGYLENRASAEGKPNTGMVKEFIDEAKKLCGLASDNDGPPPITDTDYVPF